MQNDFMPINIKQIPRETKVMFLKYNRLDKKEIKTISEGKRLFRWNYDEYYSDYELDRLDVNEYTHTGIWLTMFPMCNNKCLFCSEEFLEQVSIDFSQLSQSLKVLSKKGVKSITVSGGEPTLLGNIDEFISYLSVIGFESIQLATNGRRLKDEILTKKLIENGVDIFFISLQVFTKEKSKKINGKAKSFDETIEGLLNIKKYRNEHTRVILNHVITKYSLDEKENIIKILQKVKPDEIQFSMLEIYVHNEENFNLLASFVEISKFLRSIIPLIQELNIKPLIEGIPPCVYIGYEECYIDKTRANSKNLRIHMALKNHMNTILLNKGSLREFMDIYPDKCDGCLYRPYCSGIYYTYFQRFGEDTLYPVLSKENREERL